MIGLSAPQGTAPELKERAEAVVTLVYECERGEEGHDATITTLARAFFLDPEGLFVRAAILTLRPILAREEARLTRLREALRTLEGAEGEAPNPYDRGEAAQKGSMTQEGASDGRAPHAEATAGPAGELATEGDARDRLRRALFEAESDFIGRDEQCTLELLMRADVALARGAAGALLRERRAGLVRRLAALDRVISAVERSV